MPRSAGDAAVTDHRLPALRASPCGGLGSGFRFLRPTGARLAAREALVVCSIRPDQPDDVGSPVRFAEELNDLQEVLAPSEPGEIATRDDPSRGGYQDLLGSADWGEEEVITAIESTGTSPVEGGGHGC